MPRSPLTKEANYNEARDDGMATDQLHQEQIPLHLCIPIATSAPSLFSRHRQGKGSPVICTDLEAGADLRFLVYPVFDRVGRLSQSTEAKSNRSSRQ